MSGLVGRCTAFRDTTGRSTVAIVGEHTKVAKSKSCPRNHRQPHSRCARRARGAAFDSSFAQGQDRAQLAVQFGIDLAARGARRQHDFANQTAQNFAGFAAAESMLDVAALKDLLAKN
tara:strand:- start:120 stop:473 length:354 start_codon:yes stop_codon:yes gene_type:complete